MKRIGNNRIRMRYAGLFFIFIILFLCDLCGEISLFSLLRNPVETAELHGKSSPALGQRPEVCGIAEHLP